MAEFLKRLSEEFGVSGNETAVRNLISEQINGLADDITIDCMGNLIALKKGKSGEKNIAITTHMDEPGFIVSGINDKGYLQFKAVGTIDPRKIISKKAVIGENKIKGVIGMKAIHLQTKSERENTVSVSKLFIDIGAKDKSDAEQYVRLGDYVTFDTDFTELDDNIKGKAIERSGACAAVIDAMKFDYPFDTYFCFLTQHEVGSRGAKIISHRLNTDAVLTVSAVDTADMFGCEKNTGGAMLGGGVVVSYADKLVIADKELTDAMAEEAKRKNIPVQKNAIKDFAGDGGAMQTGADGTICLNIAIPCRYSHSPVSIMSLNDINNTTEYIKLYLNKIGELI
ncbi:MAG: M42 family metallopeptidase [Clostridia bacterium]|nr:M42 family metallopeptidase [Clostridia bacterium]